MLRWPWWSLAVSVALPASASHTSSRRLCFEHVGLQGKPMPEFCIVRDLGSRERAALPQRPTLVVMETTFDDIVHRCDADRFDARSPLTGVYRWRRDRGDTASGVAGPLTMRWITDKVRDDALRRNRTVPEVMLQLRRRLGLT